jgi:hypothetical protein
VLVLNQHIIVSRVSRLIGVCTSMCDKGKCAPCVVVDAHRSIATVCFFSSAFRPAPVRRPSSDRLSCFRVD